MTEKDSNHITVSELEDFFYDSAEDWHLWDEEVNGPYPINRIFDAMKKFIDSKKINKNINPIQNDVTT